MDASRLSDATAAFRRFSSVHCISCLWPFAKVERSNESMKMRVQMQRRKACILLLLLDALVLHRGPKKAKPPLLLFASNSHASSVTLILISETLLARMASLLSFFKLCKRAPYIRGRNSHRGINNPLCLSDANEHSSRLLCPLIFSTPVTLSVRWLPKKRKMQSPRQSRWWYVHLSNLYCRVRWLTE